MAVVVGTWRGGREVEGGGLENRRRASVRGFESLPLRQTLLALLSLLACVLPTAAHAQQAHRPRVEPALARALADPGAAVSALRAQASSPRARPGELRVIVEPEPGLRVEDLPLASIRALGARVDGVSRSRVRIAGSPAVLARVAELNGIGALHFPLVAIPVDGAGPNISQSVGLVGASPLQANGLTGSGIDVAVVDLGFWRLTEAKGTGDIPANAIGVDFVNDPNNWGIETVTSHGTGVAEQVADMAPGARLHLIQIEDEVDLELATTYLRDNGIRIANLSVNWFGSSYYDDTGPVNALINNSHDQDGVFWTVGGGNWAYRHWRGGWLDEDQPKDGWLSFKSGGDEDLGVLPETTAQVCIMLNWNQYTGTPTDFDLYVYTGTGALVSSSLVRQTAGVSPVEQVCFTPVSGQTYNARVRRYPWNASVPTGIDLTVISSNVTIEASNRVPASSMVDPAVAHGAFAVGAVDYTVWTTAPVPESLSSWGPTTDGRPKPDLVAPDRTNSLTRAGVPGTSFASPVVAGAAVLMLAQNSTLTNLQLRAGLIAAAQDVGTVGQDSLFGWGKLVVPIVSPGPDSDADGVQDAWDLCPFTPDPSQLDANSDGIGDACQCGDLSGDGLISSADTDLVQAWLADPTSAPAGLARCNVLGAAIPAGDDCRVDDWAVLQREIGGALPGLTQGCAPALP